MIYAVMGYATFVNINRRNSAYDEVAAELATRTTWGPVELYQTTDISGSAALGLNVRVTAEPDMHDLFTRAQAVLAQQGWATGWLHWHFCHNDGPAPCTIAPGSEVVP